MSQTPPTVEPHPPSVPPARKGQWTCASLLALGSLTGLIVIAYLIFGPGHDSADTHTQRPGIPWTAIGAALLTGVLGVGLLWIGVLGSRPHSLAAHLIHELGMGCIVASAMILVIEGALHVHFEHEILALQKKHAGEMKTQQDTHDAKVLSEQTVREDLQKLLLNLGAERRVMDRQRYGVVTSEQLVKNAKDRVAIVNELQKNKLKDSEQLDVWLTYDFDRIGRHHLSRMEYLEAIKMFEDALVIDRRLSKQFPDSFEYNHNVPVSHGLLAQALFNLGQINAAIVRQNEALAEWDHFVKAFKLNDEIHKKNEADQASALKALANYNAKLEECRQAIAKYLENAKATMDVLGNAKGKFDEKQPWHTVKTSLTKGKKYQIDLTTTTADLDPYLIVTHQTAGVLFLDHDDNDAKKENFNSSIVVIAPETGDYWIVATTAPKPTPSRTSKKGDFTLNIRTIESVNAK